MHTITPSLLRLSEVQYMANPQGRRIYFITAMTHAATEACLKKLFHLIECYRFIDALPTKAARIDAPRPLIHIGTIFQAQFLTCKCKLYNFSKKDPFTVD